jgi:uncharacterized protein
MQGLQINSGKTAEMNVPVSDDKHLYLDLARLDPEGAQVAGELDFSVIDVDDGSIAGGSRISYDLYVQVVSNELIVTGKVEMDVTLVCCRCAAPFSFHAAEPAYEYYEEMENIPECVELTSDIREAIILAFPSYPICRDDCRSLCAQCGVNLNQEECECADPEDPRWAGLNDLGKE